MSTRRIRAGRAEIEATIKNRLGAGLRKMKAQLSSFAATTGKIGGAALGVGIVAMAPLVKGVQTFLKAGDALDKMSARTGASVESLSTLGHVANITGTDITSMEKGIIGMQKTLRNAERGLSTATDALADVGLKASELEGLSTDQQILKIADALQNVDPSKRAALAMDIFGKAGQKMLPMLNLGAEGIAKLQQKARDMGLEMSGEDAGSAAELTDRLFELKEIIKGTAIQIGAALAPVLIRAAEGLSKFAQHALEFVRNNRGLVVGIAAGVGALILFGAGMLTVAAASAIASMAVGAFIGLLSIAGTILGVIASPIGIITGLLIGGVGAWLYYSGTGSEALGFLKEKMSELLAWGKKIFGGMQDAIAAGDWATAGKILWTSLKIAWQTGIGWLHGLWLDFKHNFIGIFDTIGAAIRLSWQATIDSIANGILWVVDKINTASKAVTGARLIAIDTEAIRDTMKGDADRFKKSVIDGIVQRQKARDSAKSEALKKYDTGELNKELEGLITSARESREAIEAEEETPDQRSFDGAGDIATAAAASPIASVGSFNAVAAETFAGRGVATLEDLQRGANITLKLLLSAVKDSNGMTFG